MTSPLPLPLLDGTSFLIDNSSTETFTTCPRSAGYLVSLSRRSASDRPALTFGKFIHSALELRYRSAAPMLGQTAEVERVMMAQLMKDFADWSPPIDDHRTYDMAVQVIRAYGEHYPFEEFTVLRDEHGPFVERPFALPLGRLEINAEILVQPLILDQDNIPVRSGPPVVRFVPYINIIWTGRIDLVYEQGSRVYVLDHKSTSIMGPKYFKEHELSNQQFGYVWAVEQLIQRQVFGFVINALAIRRPTKTGKGIEFARQPFHVDRWQIDEWITNTLHIVADFIEMVRRQYLPGHFKWCEGKYGSCPYKNVCCLPPEQRSIMLNSDLYEDVSWTPLKD